MDSPSRSAELLRLALPLMSRQRAAPHPLSYAVWYEHVSGRNRALSDDIARLTQGEGRLDEEQTVELYAKHVVDVDERTAARVADGFRAVLKDMAESAQQAGTQTERFDDSLSRWNRQIEDGQAADPEALKQVLAGTAEMRTAVSALQTRLEASRAEVTRLRDEIERARDEAMSDALTGLANRRAFERRLAECLSRGPAPRCLLVTDIDHFKRVNDTYGHLFGDQVLKVVAQGVRSCIAPEHLAARVGGEEFAIVLDGASPAQAQSIAERIRATIAGSRIRRRDSDETIGQITVSLGVALHRTGESAEAWFDRADQALYASKQNGRNRVTLAAA